jgi:PAS domain S-box-containing protein
VDERFLDERVLDDPLVGAVSPRPFPRAAQALLAVMLVAAVGGGIALWRDGPPASGWLVFAVLAPCAAVAQVRVVPTGRNHGFHTAFLFMTAAVLLLPPPLLVLMGIAQHAVEARSTKTPWYIKAFNAANTTLDVLVAWAVVRLVLGANLGNAGWAIAAWAAAAVLILTNHFLLASMLRLARGHRLRESGLFSPESLLLELVPAALGIVFARFWLNAPWLLPAALAPLVLTEWTFRLLARLRESETRFRTIFELSPIGIALTDLDGKIAAANPALEQMVGYGATELVGRSWDEITAPDDYAANRSAATALASGEPAAGRLESRYVAKNGQTVFGAKSIALVRDNDGEPQYVLSTIENVTERKELAERLGQAQKMEAIGRLAGGVAHDFNNMLTAIGGYSELALARIDGGGAATRRELDEIRKATDRAALLTGRLLAFSRKQTLQPRLVDPNEIVADLEGMLGRLIGDDVTIRTVLGADAGRITADPGQLEQLIVNLVVNARDAMPKGGSITIETQAREIDEQSARRADAVPGTYVVLVVADTGVGMSAEMRARIFEPFFTTKDAGTGLGLSTVYGIVAQNGGFIDLETAPGRGTTYRIHLPQTPAAAVAEVPAEAQSGPSVAGATVLLVEDEEVVRSIVAELLEEQGCTVLEAANAQEALVLARGGEELDLLLSDVAMPGMNGVDLAIQLRAEGLVSRIVFMSGHAGSAFDQADRLDVPYGFLQKPFSRPEFLTELAAALDRDQELVG